MSKYILISFVAAGIAFLGTRLERRFEGHAGRAAMVLSLVLSALVFCVIAGIRNVQVGTDVEMYVLTAFDAAQHTSMSEFAAEAQFARWMPLSKFFFWVVPHFVPSLFFFLFMIEAVIVLPLYVSLRITLKEYTWLGILVFGIAFFPMSFNIMRQFMGMGFILLSYVFVQKRKPLFFLLCIGIACLIHETCIVGALVYPLWLLASGNLKKIEVGPVSLGLIALTAAQVIFPALKSLAFVLGRYASYVNGLISREYGGGGSQELFFMIAIGVVSGAMYHVFTSKKIGIPSKRNDISGLAAIVFVGIGVFSLCLYSFQLFRLGVFLIYFAVVLIPKAYASLNGGQEKRAYAIVSMCLLMLLAQSYYGAGSHEVVPYIVDLSDKF